MLCIGYVVSVSRKVHLLCIGSDSIWVLWLRTRVPLSFVFSIVDYYCLLLNDPVGELDTRLQWLMNSSIRFVFSLKRDVHISPCRRQISWLSVKRRIQYFMGCSTYNIVNGNTPSYLLASVIRPSPSLRLSRLPMVRVFAVLSCRRNRTRMLSALRLFISGTLFCCLWSLHLAWELLKLVFLSTLSPLTSICPGVSTLFVCHSSQCLRIFVIIYCILFINFIFLISIIMCFHNVFSQCNTCNSYFVYIV